MVGLVGIEPETLNERPEPRSLLEKQLDADQPTMLLAEIKGRLWMLLSWKNAL